MARLIIILIISSVLIHMASAKSGKATFYTDYTPSACYENKKEGTMIAAANPKLYNGGKVCGQRYKIRCTGGTNHGDKPCRGGHVTVKIVDLCPECADDQLDLSKQAFRKIGNLDAGVIRINYVDSKRLCYAAKRSFASLKWAIGLTKVQLQQEK